MPIPEMTPQQKYQQFIQTHPKYKNLSIDKVCLIMVKEKLLNANDVKELKKPLFGNGFVNSAPAFIEEGMNNLGINTNNKKTKPKNYVEVPKRYHPNFSELEVTKSGKVDFNQFSMQSLKAKYDSKNYTITKNDNGNISVTKKDGTPVMSINEFFGEKNVTYENNGKIVTVGISKTGEIHNYQTTEIKNNVQYTKRYDGTNKFPSRVYSKYPDGSYGQINYDTKTGKITFQDFWEKDGNSPQKVIEYTNGQPYIKRINGKTEFVLVNDLKDDIFAKNALGLPTTRQSLSNNVLKRITSVNVTETIKEYKKLTGNNLIDDIENEIGLPRSTRDKLINHIETLYCKEASGEESGKYLAQALYDDISGLGSGKLSEHLKMINSENLKYVMTEYKTISFNNFYKTSADIRSLLEHIPGIRLDYKDSEKLTKKLAPIEGLLTAIQGETGIPKAKRDSLTKQIVDLALKDKAPEVKKRISRDISNHPEDYHKVEIDIYRAENTKGGDLRNPNLKNQKTKETKNKTFNGQIKQGKTGDCWLLAGLNSIIAKPKMRAELEKLVKIDSKTGDYIVNLKGAKKTYRITKRDLQEYPNLATGSEKVNAIEIAMDKYLRDDAYNDRNDSQFVDKEFGSVSTVDLNGNGLTTLWNTLFDNGEPDLVRDPLKENFNAPNKTYTMSLMGDEDIYGLARSEKEENCTIHKRHAYSIVGSDEKNIYLLNPWDSDNKITIARADFKKLGAYIVSYELDIA